MATYLLGTVSFDADYAGMTGQIGYRLVGADGAVVQPFTTANVIEASIPGIYEVYSNGVYGVPIPSDTWNGKIVWGTATLDLAQEWIGAPSWYTPTAVPPAPIPVSQISTLSEVYCSDEDLALNAFNDYLAICPESQVMAVGVDGTFTVSDRWTLFSDVVEFAAAGVRSGHVVSLTEPRSTFGRGALLAVDTADTRSITLRRLGKPTGQGMPPGPIAGLTGVKFSIPTFDPQIEIASFDANRWCGIDANIPGQRASDIYDLRVLRQFCVLSVLIPAYTSAMRGGGGSHLQIRIDQLQAEFVDLRARTVVQWGALGQVESPTSIFNARARR